MGGGLMQLVAYGAQAEFNWRGSPGEQGYVADNDVYAAAARIALQYHDAVLFDTKDTFDTLQKKFGECLWSKEMIGKALSLASELVTAQNTFLGQYGAAFIATSSKYVGMALGVVVGEAGPKSVTYLVTTSSSTITQIGITPVGEQKPWGFPPRDVNNVNAMLNAVRARPGEDSKNGLDSYAFALRPEEPQPSMLPLMMKKIVRAMPLPEGDDIALGFVMQDFDSETGHAGKRKILALVQNIPCAPGYNQL